MDELSDLWFTDGDVILRMDEVSFRVHRKVLRLNSEVFSRFFDNNPVLPSDEMSPPTVFLSGPSSPVIDYLQAIYSTGIDDYQELKTLPTKTCTALLAEGRRFKNRNMFTAIVQRMAVTWPNSVNGWDKRDLDQIRVGWWKGQAFDGVLLARKHGLNALLPALFYDIVETFTVEEIAAGFQRKDLSWSRIAIVDIITCAAARDKIYEIQKSTTFSWLKGDFLQSQSCSDSESCKTRRIQIEMKFLHSTPQIHGLTDWAEGWSEGFCMKCKEHAKFKFQVGREEFWHELPGIFNLGTWEGLQVSQLKQIVEIFDDETEDLTLLR